MPNPLDQVSNQEPRVLIEGGISDGESQVLIGDGVGDGESQVLVGDGVGDGESQVLIEGGVSGSESQVLVEGGVSDGESQVLVEGGVGDGESQVLIDGGVSDGELRALIEDADLASLLAALSYSTGNLRLVPESLWLDPSRALEPEGGWDEDQLKQARQLAIDGLQQLRSLTATPEATDSPNAHDDSPGTHADLLLAHDDSPGTHDDSPLAHDGSLCTHDDSPSTHDDSLLAHDDSSLEHADSLRAGDKAHDDSLLARLIDWLTGAELDDGYRTMLTEELAISGDQRIPNPINTNTWPGSSGAGPAVAVIGAGMSGILAAHRLQQANVDFVVLEKNDDVGGTWFENTYPGCRVDVFNHVYSYSCEQKPDWPEYHSRQEVLLEYFRDCAQRWGIVDRIRFGVRVESLTWDDQALRWRIQLQTASGVEVVTVAAVISAVGQLNQPLMPAINGINDFTGEWFHSSDWRHDINWHDRKVAVIGTGASALQFIPHLADMVKQLTVFQRTPPWLIPRPEYHQPLPDGLMRLFKMVPGYANWFRLRLFWRTHEGTVNALRRDPGWHGPLDRSVSERNELMRVLLTGYLESEFKDREDLLSKVVPDYPVGAKRVVLDNGIWARTLKQPHVELVNRPIARITEDSVLDSEDRHHRADVIVYGTGFRASEFLMPMRVTGRDGIDLHETWAGDARAYMGVCVPGFPNLFCLYGPNTNIVINGSIIYFSECAVHYAVECLRLLSKHGHAAMDCRQKAYTNYSNMVDKRNDEMAWGISNVNSWYKSPSGRMAQNWPFPLVDYWRQTRIPAADDFKFLS